MHTLSLHSLKRLQYCLPIRTKNTLVQTLLLPLLDYADVYYTDVDEEILDKLDRFRSTCIRFIFDLHKYDHVSNSRQQLNWLPVRLRRNLHIPIIFSHFKVILSSLLEGAFSIGTSKRIFFFLIFFVIVYIYIFVCLYKINVYIFM